MFCPTCGQQQIANSSRFCSQCGFLLTGVQTLIANNGSIPGKEGENPALIKDSPRKRGIKKGLWILLVGMLLVSPLAALIHIATNTEPFLMGLSMILGFFGGILRMIYALLFEDNTPMRFGTFAERSMPNSPELLESQRQNFLPPQQTIPVNSYSAPKPGIWRDTNEIVKPHSVIEPTTNLLKNE